MFCILYFCGVKVMRKKTERDKITAQISGFGFNICKKICLHSYPPPPPPKSRKKPKLHLKNLINFEHGCEMWIGLKWLWLFIIVCHETVKLCHEIWNCVMTYMTYIPQYIFWATKSRLKKIHYKRFVNQ